MDVSRRHITGKTMPDYWKAVAAFGFTCYQQHGRGMVVENVGTFNDQEGNYASDMVYHVCDKDSPKLPIEIIELLLEYDPSKECISTSRLETNPFISFMLLKSDKLFEDPGDIYKIEHKYIEIISEMITPPGTVYELEEPIPGVMPGKYAFLYEDTAKLFLMKMEEFHNEYDFGDVVEVHLDYWELFQPTGEKIKIPDIESELEEDDKYNSDLDNDNV